MGALSDADSFQPHLIEELPEQVTERRRVLSQEIGLAIAPWPWEIELYRRADRIPPSD